MNAVIIPAAGQSRRMGRDKLFLRLNNKMVIKRTLDVFLSVNSIDEIILVASDNNIRTLKDLVKKYTQKTIKIVLGGSTRTASVANGLKVLDEKTKSVLIHDGARPFIEADLIENIIAHLESGDLAVIPGVSPKDTIKKINGGKVHETLKRDALIQVQTPQGFSRKTIEAAYKNALSLSLKATDDSALVEAMNIPVKVIQGSYDNIKITTQEDIKFGEAILKG